LAVKEVTVLQGVAMCRQRYILGSASHNTISCPRHAVTRRPGEAGQLKILRHGLKATTDRYGRVAGH
jgi:hypothetical protein